MKKFSFEFKATDIEKGEFEGLASVYGNEDSYGDIVEPGAFKRTLDHKKGKVPLLWQHDPSDVIGIGEISDSEKGLVIKGRLNLAVGKAREAYELIKQGAVSGLSIGYDTVLGVMEQGIRHLKELRLWEVSVVTFPANDLAQIQTVKEAKDFDVILSLVVNMATAKTTVDEKNVKAAIRSLETLLALKSGLTGSGGSSDAHPAPAAKAGPGTDEIAKVKASLEVFLKTLSKGK